MLIYQAEHYSICCQFGEACMNIMQLIFTLYCSKGKQSGYQSLLSFANIFPGITLAFSLSCMCTFRIDHLVYITTWCTPSQVSLSPALRAPQFSVILCVGEAFCTLPYLVQHVCCNCLCSAHVQGVMLVILYGCSF